MKNSRKVIIKIFSIVMMLMVVFTTGTAVFAAPSNGIAPELPDTGNEQIGQVTALGGKIWNTVSVIVQILAIAAIVFAGVRYMFASADSKADIKQQTIVLVVGALLVFAAVPIAGFIANTAGQIF